MTQIALRNEQPGRGQTSPEQLGRARRSSDQPAQAHRRNDVQTHDTSDAHMSAEAPAHDIHDQHARTDSRMKYCLRVQSNAKPRGPIARFLGFNPLHPDARGPYRAAVGESEVAGILAALGPEWQVLHVEPDETQPDAPAHGAPATEPDIDHLIIGPPGIFAITSKNHTGHTVIATGDAVILDTRKTQYMAKSLYEASRASEFLQRVTGAPVTVTPLIVVVGVQRIARRLKPPIVRVVPSSKLAQLLAKESRVMSDETVDFFSRAADLCSTWRNRTALVEETRQHVRFERLQDEVGAAGKRRRVWSLAVSLLLLVGMPATAFATSTLVISLLQA